MAENEEKIKVKDMAHYLAITVQCKDDAGFALAEKLFDTACAVITETLQKIEQVVFIDIEKGLVEIKDD